MCKLIEEERWGIVAAIAIPFILVCGILNYYGLTEHLELVSFGVWLVGTGEIVHNIRRKMDSAIAYLKADTTDREDIFVSCATIAVVALIAVSGSFYPIEGGWFKIWGADCEMYLTGPLAVYLPYYALHSVVAVFALLFVSYISGMFLIVFPISLIGHWLFKGRSESITQAGNDTWSSCMIPMSTYFVIAQMTGAADFMGMFNQVIRAVIDLL